MELVRALCLPPLAPSARRVFLCALVAELESLARHQSGVGEAAGDQLDGGDMVGPQASLLLSLIDSIAVHALLRKTRAVVITVDCSIIHYRM